MVTWAEAEKQSKQHCETVLATVAKRYGFTKEELRASWGSDRRATRYYARQVAIYLTWRLVPLMGMYQLARAISADCAFVRATIQSLERRQQNDAAFAGELAKFYLGHFDEMIMPRV